MEPIVTGGSGGKGNCEKMVFNITWMALLLLFQNEIPLTWWFEAFVMLLNFFKANNLYFEKGRAGKREERPGCGAIWIDDTASKAPPSSHLFESDKWHRECNFLFTSTDYFLTNCFSWCVVIVGSYCCVQSVQKSAFFCVAEKSMAWWKAHMQSNLLYILYIWWPLTTKRTLWGT